MKQYLIAKQKVNEKMALMPLSTDNEKEWQEFIKYLIHDNPNTAVTLLKSRCIDFCNFINLKYPEITNFGEKIFLFYSDISKDVTCKCCSNKTIFNNITSGYRKYCSIKCKNSDPDIKAKIKNTCLERYGASSPFKSIECQSKTKNTNIKKYGHYNVFGGQIIKDKIKLTSLNRYGTENPAQSNIVRNKMKQTCQERYGVDFITQTDIFKEKSKITCLQKYGVEFPMQHLEIMNKGMKSAKRLKDFKLPSGKIIQYQGYENVAIEFLLNFYNEDDLMFFKDVPTFRYGPKSRIYFPDLFIKSSNTIIEVKSTWTLSTEEQYKELFEKSEEVVKQGYNFKLFICSKTKILQTYDGVINDRKEKEN